MVKVARIAEDWKVLSIEERELPAEGGLALAADEIELTGIEAAIVVAGLWRFDAAVKGFEELPFKALLLDQADVYIDLVELASSADLTAQHVDLRPLGGDCDQPFGKYRWDREKRTLVPLPKTAQRPAAEGVSLERALADFWDQLERAGTPLPKSTRAWLEQFRGSIDNKKGVR